ncbi:hypothetical protein GGQ80_003371 [Sphingomonas jinjuensis]|uniref:PilZ domain-containing protein n=1 Tax=Sphingomonas jinjuensis TaxID=535907 RepID=A0A840FNG7_9SPHN|nr:PilZ domain-containing protein [Sphingomonas jinjuensis]MBB4155448.1 hypothetical protein [Sphingomonas jinjuensis]
MILTRASDASTSGHIVSEPREFETMKPRARRVSVMLTVLIAANKEAPATCHRVRNISEGGMRIDRTSDLQSGNAVFLTIGKLVDVAATVVWTSENAAGLVFGTPINPIHATAKIAPRTSAIQPGFGDTKTTCKAGWFHSLQNAYRHV